MLDATVAGFNMAKIFLVDLEAVETRYTGQWKTHVPDLLKERGHDVTIITGPDDIPAATTPGAFLNFGGTNAYKSAQGESMARAFTGNGVSPGSHFIFTDAWHPSIINLRYMSSLLGIDIKIHALWHAGSYDPQDFLGRLIGDAAWVRHTEKAFFHAIDYNYFATDFHIDMFLENLLTIDTNKGRARYLNRGKIRRTGWPMEYLDGELSKYKTTKRDLILFPHRIAPEKQVDIFEDLSRLLPQYEFVVCQDQHLTKDQYHKLLGQAKMVFSANLQETLGISCYEGMLAGAIPVVPDRLSYSEMYYDAFRYPSHWTQSWQEYQNNRHRLQEFIINLMNNYDNYQTILERNTEALTKDYFSANKLLDNIDKT